MRIFISAQNEGRPGGCIPVLAPGVHAVEPITESPKDPVFPTTKHFPLVWCHLSFLGGLIRGLHSVSFANGASGVDIAIKSAMSPPGLSEV